MRGFTGALMVFAMLGTVTGMFEMPGYQGRYLYLLLLLGLPVAASLLIRTLAPWLLRRTRRRRPPVRHLFRWRVIAAGAIAACLPSVRLPPGAQAGRFPSPRS
ncbi:MAG: hypothetical protein U1G05_14230 [Kiritimatiellia bacterium]